MRGERTDNFIKSTNVVAFFIDQRTQSAPAVRIPHPPLLTVRRVQTGRAVARREPRKEEEAVEIIFFEVREKKKQQQQVDEEK